MTTLKNTYCYYYRQNFTDFLSDPDEIGDSQPLSLSSSFGQNHDSSVVEITPASNVASDSRTHQSVRRPDKGTGQCGEFRSVDEIGFYVFLLKPQLTQTLWSKIITRDQGQRSRFSKL